MEVLHTAIAIVLAIGLIIVVKVDPVISLIVSSLYLGLAAGVGFADTVAAITTGFGDIMAKVGLTNRLMALLIIWTTAFIVLRYKRAEQATKILRGLLPICASCKKIRDDKGYWKLLEEYLEQHSEAYFTHGMCTECMAKWETENLKEAR